MGSHPHKFIAILYKLKENIRKDRFFIFDVFKETSHDLYTRLSDPPGTLLGLFDIEILNYLIFDEIVV